MIKNKTEQVILEQTHHNPAFYENLRQRLLRLICEEKERRKTNAEYFHPESKFREIYQQVMSYEQERIKLGFETNLEFSIYGFINKHFDNQDVAKKITRTLHDKLFPLTSIVEYYNKPSIERKMKGIIYDILENGNVQHDEILQLSDKILDMFIREHDV